MIITSAMSVLIASLIANGALPEQPAARRAVAHITAPGEDGIVCDPRGDETLFQTLCRLAASWAR